MPTKYISVTLTGFEDSVCDVPTEPSGCFISLQSLQVYFPNAIGLKFLPRGSSRMRAVRVDDDKLMEPLDGWESGVMYTAVVKEGDTQGAAGGKSGASSAEEEEESDTEDEQTDLVVLGLPYTCTNEDLREYFKAFGKVEFVSIKKHKDTGRSKGFGFVRFSSPADAMKVLVKRHKIGNKVVDVQVSESTKIKSENTDLKRKVHISDLSEDTTEADLQGFFEKYGKITQVYRPKPFRRYAFVTFESSSVAQNLVKEGSVIFNHKKVKITSAYPKNTNPRFSSMSKGGSGGSGGGDRRYNGGVANKRFASQQVQHQQQNGYVDPWMRDNHQPLNTNLLEAVMCKALTEVLNLQNRPRDPRRRY